MLGIPNVVHAWVFQFSRCLLEQETQTNPMWAPQQGLVFIRRNDVIYGGPGFDIIYVHTWPLGISWGSDGHDSRPLFEPEM